MPKALAHGGRADGPGAEMVEQEPEREPLRRREGEASSE